MDRDELIEFLRRCGVTEARLADLSAMERLRADLVKANRSTNLTRITSDDDFWLLHLADSLAVGTAAPELMTEALSVADVGCGAGFPMLPLAWANPALAVTGIDGRGRKIEFVQRQIESLGLARCRAVAGNARELARLPEHAGSYDVVLLRAVAAPGKLLRECRALPRPGGKIIFYATPASADDQREISRREAGKFGLDLAEPPTIALPGGAGQRRFVIFTRRA
jgi:16S rRNA (guanine527-N7)-methyltransferase